MTAAYLGLLSSTARINAFLTSDNHNVRGAHLAHPFVGTRGGVVWSGGLMLVLRTCSLLSGRTSTSPPPICPTSPCPLYDGLVRRSGVRYSLQRREARTPEICPCPWA